VSETVLELARYVGVRRGDSRRDDDDFRMSGGGPGGGASISMPGMSAPGRIQSKGWSPSNPDAGRKQRNTSTTGSSTFRSEREFLTHPGSTSGTSNKTSQQAFGHQRNPPSTSDPSSSTGSSSSPIFDAPLTTSSVGGGESGLGAEETGEDAWSELKVCSKKYEHKNSS
jgi:hypothetical protein